MKTAISIRDEIFEAAERTARALGISRSELYATAVKEFVARHSQLVTLDRNFLTARAGRLTDVRLRQVEDGLHLVLSL